MSFSCQKGEFYGFFNWLDRPVEESRPDRPVDPIDFHLCRRQSERNEGALAEIGGFTKIHLTLQIKSDFQILHGCKYAQFQKFCIHVDKNYEASSVSYVACFLSDP